MKRIDQWLSDYGESHRNETNKLIHWICVPSIFFSVTALLYGIKLPLTIAEIQVNLAMVMILLITIYYLSLSRTIWIGMLVFGITCLWICHLLQELDFLKLWQIAIIIFVLAWVGQFYGHKIEGKKPSFLKDLQFLLIGPMWLMTFIYSSFKIKY